MKREVVLDYYIHNGNIISTINMALFDRISEESVYEVIKLVDGIPLFFDEHLDRMKKSILSLGGQLKKPDDEILMEIIRLAELNDCKDINVKLVFDFIQKDKGDFVTYFIKSEYPDPNAYKSGIHTITFQGERSNPNIKTLNASFRERVKEAREREGAYEALLIDENGNISEGSRSNIFFVMENEIITPPGRTVLLGVTRSYVMKICEQLGIPIMESPINMEDIDRIKGAFITGTTVDILPIGSINKIKMQSNHIIIKNIIGKYNEALMNDIKVRREYLSKIK